MLVKHWNITSAKQETEITDNSIHPVVLNILLNRGYISSESQRKFLQPSLAEMPDPFLLKGMKQAVCRLLKARELGEQIFVYGDYDVDGITSTALLVSFLRNTGFLCSYFIPNRFEDGYGLNKDSLQKCMESGAKIIVSVDCGITSVSEAIFCREKCIDLIIVDHHAPKKELPDCTAIINALQPGCTYPFKFLAAVGVTFNLLVALRAELRNKGAFTLLKEPDLRESMDLVALGTIADVVPLTGENRLYAYYGLKQLSLSNRAGIVALKQVASVSENVTCGQVGFRMAPRLNAAGRMESAVPGVDLLLTSDSNEAKIIASELDSANAERQHIERNIFEQAIAMLEESGTYPQCATIVLASNEWHQGVIGIVASRIVERYYRPTILLAIDGEGMAKGSGRSIPGFHLLDALNSCSTFLKSFGGHGFAAGVALQADAVSPFAASFESASKKQLGNMELQPLINVDLEVSAVQVTTSLAESLQYMAPFGSGNQEPVLFMKDLALLDSRIMAEKHLRLRLKKDGVIFNAIAFGMAHRTLTETMDILFFPEINLWQGNKSLQLKIKDFRPSES